MTGLLLLSVFGPLNRMPLPPSAPSFSFIAMGDNRPAQAGLPPTTIFRSLLKDAEVIAPSFIISSGDLVFGKDEPLSLYNQECGQIKALLNQLPCPFFNAVGNHEISERKDLYDSYVRQFGPTYGSFVYGNWRFLAVSTEELGATPGIGDDEMKWLQSELSLPGPKIVFQHHPVYARVSNQERANTVTHADEVAALYNSGNVKFAFQGHDHCFDHQTHDGLEYYISGGAGAPLDASPSDGGYFHFLYVTVTGNDVKVGVVPQGALQISPNRHGAIVGNYSQVNLPLRNLKVRTSYKPTGLSGSIALKGGKKKTVIGHLRKVQRISGGYMSTVEIVAESDKATRVVLSGG